MNKPVLLSAAVTPNPAQTNKPITIVLDVEDREIVFQKSIYYAGEIKAGEKIGVL